MSTILVTYADQNMTTSMALCCQSALKNGCDVSWPQNPDTIDESFKLFNRDIWQPGNRGADCFWLFKPYVIYRAMLTAKEGDIIVYADAGGEFVGNVQQVIACMNGDIMLFNNGFKHVEWCKLNVISKIDKTQIHDLCFGGEKVVSEFYRSRQQAQASFQIYKVSNQSIKFVKEWLMYCQMPGMIDDSPSDIGNFPTFAEHRHDQAILTCLAIKYSIELHWCPLTMNMHRLDMKLPGDNYPAILNHHRRRNKGTPGNNPTW